ncbi:hypothetical protein FB567DRAFT_588966 [Paraphoma chrysanthemicola]|uniref:tyrosinase n=1 Tax=Paraphoma chrysanthemicola TaxID=798071 RepID=A0A8K0RBX9_9PLEO|nr:hypothetical protein FB567DRAFT_588966 [Paraphoma chrysanthemicola]
MKAPASSTRFMRFWVLATLSCHLASSNKFNSRYKHHMLAEFVTSSQEKASRIPQPAVLGIKRFEGDNAVPRIEIRELERRPDQFNVFLLGLQRFQNISQDDQLSYFSIAGIHGRPFTSWGGVEKDPKGSLGYCRHSSNIFSTWHRPYLALFEEMIYKNAMDVISEFPEGEFKVRMNDALHQFRLPYWDAAAVPPIGEGSYPWCVQRTTIEVELPSGDTTCKVFIQNPLFSYTFHPLPVEYFRSVASTRTDSAAVVDRWIEWNRTVRFPTTKDSTAQSQDRLVAFHLDWNSENIRQRTYSMLAMQKDYYNISNNLVRTSRGEIADSLESVHDTLHNTVGDGGHMWQTQYSSFDPIFWLLHANTDRMLAIWQALNPESYVTNHSNPLATFSSPPKSWADEHTPLHPFRCDDAGNFWTSETVRDHTKFGYTYPELVGLSEKDTLVRRVNALYGENATSQFSWDQDQQPTDDVSSVVSSQSSSSSCTTRSGLSTEVTTACRDDRGHGNRDRRHGHSAQRLDVQYHYFANIRAAKGGSDRAFKVYIYLDSAIASAQDVSGNTQAASTPILVGYTGFQSTAYQASEMLPNEMQKTGGVVALTKALEEKARVGEVASLDEATVAPYLREHMTWKIALAGDQEVFPEEVPGLEIEVSWAKFTPPTPKSFPEVQNGGFKHLMFATTGKAGGVNDA